MDSKLTRFKVEIDAYFGTRRRHHIFTTHVTAVVWDDSRGAEPYKAKRIGWSREDMSTGKPCSPPMLFSKAAAERIAEQLPKWDLCGEGPGGKPVIRVVAVEK